jgi:hypothetical protein
MQLYSNHVARLALLVLLAQPKSVAMRDVALKGVIDPQTRALAGTVVAVIGMPISRVSITGQLRARIACDGTFTGTVSYSRTVRIFAALKRTDLVTQLDGSIVDTLQVTQAQSSPMLGSSVVQPAAIELSFALLRAEPLCRVEQPCEGQEDQHPGMFSDTGRDCRWSFDPGPEQHNDAIPCIHGSPKRATSSRN